MVRGLSERAKTFHEFVNEFLDEIQKGTKGTKNK